MYRVLGEVVLWCVFVASGGHIYEVARDMGNWPPVAIVHAIGLDGLVYIGIGACRNGTWIRGVVAVVYGGGMSLAFNWASYSDSGLLPPWVIAMSMPVALVLSVITMHATKTVPPAETPEETVETKPVSPPRPARKPTTSPPVVRPETPPPSNPAATETRRSKPTTRATTGKPHRSEADRDRVAADVIAKRTDKAAAAADQGVSTRSIENWIESYRERHIETVLGAAFMPPDPPPVGPANGHDFSQVKAGEN